MDVLTIMFFLGIAQLIWAAIHAWVTDVSRVRKHFLNYAIGVVIYFSVLIMFAMIPFSVYIMGVGFLCLFFGGAFGLAIYHFLIVCLSIWLWWSGDLENQPTADHSVSESVHSLNPQ